MSQTIQSHCESTETIGHLSWGTGTKKTQTKTAKARIYSFETSLPPQNKTDGFSSLSSFISELESQSPKHKEGLESARKWVGETQYSGTENTLKSVRLSRGLSQAALAELTATSQPHIARIESGREDVRLSTLKKLSDALSLNLDEVSTLIDNQQIINAESLK